MRTGIKAGAAALLALLGVGALAGCAGTVATESKNVPGRTEEQGVSTKVNLHTNGAVALLEQAHEAVALGDYDHGLACFQAALTHPAAKPEHKAEALLGLGATYSNVLNAKRDVPKAIDAYQRLISEYPDSKLRETAEKALAGLQGSAGK